MQRRAQTAANGAVADANGYHTDQVDPQADPVQDHHIFLRHHVGDVIDDIHQGDDVGDDGNCKRDAL
ncbi:hypothetical protein D3C72_2191530 [compost metagenome]